MLQRKAQSCDSTLQGRNVTQDFIFIELPSGDVQKVICLSIDGIPWVFPHPVSWSYLIHEIEPEYVWLMIKAASGGLMNLGQHLVKAKQMTFYSSDNLRIQGSTTSAQIQFVSNIIPGMRNGLWFVANDIPFINDATANSSELMFTMNAQCTDCAPLFASLWPLCIRMTYNLDPPAAPIAPEMHVRDELFADMLVLFEGGGGKCATSSDNNIDGVAFAYPAN